MNKGMKKGDDFGKKRTLFEVSLFLNCYIVHCVTV